MELWKTESIVFVFKTVHQMSIFLILQQKVWRWRHDAQHIGAQHIGAQHIGAKPIGAQPIGAQYEQYSA